VEGHVISDMKKIQKLEAENARLRDALEFYADEAAYGYYYNSEKESVIDVIADSGDIAREALKGGE
jgi:hypothetical protein